MRIKNNDSDVLLRKIPNQDNPFIYLSACAGGCDNKARKWD